MSDFKDLIKKRRSIRKFVDKKIKPEDVELILKAGLMSPTCRGFHSWHFIAVEDKEMLRLLSTTKEAGLFLANAALAVIVVGDPFVNDAYVEDCSIAAFAMQLQAEDLNIGSCWVQIRNRYMENGISCSDYIKSIFEIPLQLDVVTVIGFGYKAVEKASQDESELLWEKVSIDKFKI